MKSLNNNKELWTNMNIETLEERQEYTAASGWCCDWCCLKFGCCDWCCFQIH